MEDGKVDKNSKKVNYEIKQDAQVEFYNRMDFCVGTGRMDLALQEEYIRQLTFVQEKIGFQYIRGHGLFSKGMAIYQERSQEDGSIREEYNFTYLDRVMDRYHSLHIRPFLELGFMPDQMASGKDTVFYWNGNITPPVSYEKWARLVKATLRHFLSRYGEEEVLQWPIEVWNEPNLAVFWKDANETEYFHLYEVTARAVKEVHPNLRVGGPAICGVDDERWLREFLDFVEETNVPLDFITRHHYVSHTPEQVGHYEYVNLYEPSLVLKELEKTREIIDSYHSFQGMELHITEFNTSYVSDAPVHDTCYQAAYIASMLSRLGDCNTSYSYWTFGDVFEEKGVPFTPFHGGFGLVANGVIPKPVFWSFAFFKKLQGVCIHRSKEAVIVRQKEGKYLGVAWNLDHSNSGTELILELAIEVGSKNVEGLEFCLIGQTIDELHGNPLKVWHEMGEPANPDNLEMEILRDAARPWIWTETVLAYEGKAKMQIKLEKNAVVGFELRLVNRQQDNGYDYNRVMQR